MLKLRLTRDDNTRFDYISWICTVPATALQGLVIGGNDDSDVFKAKLTNWINHHLGLLDIELEQEYCEDLILTIRIAKSYKRIGTIIVSVGEDNDYSISKVSFDEMLDQNTEYYVVLNEILYSVLKEKFI